MKIIKKIIHLLFLIGILFLTANLFGFDEKFFDVGLPKKEYKYQQKQKKENPIIRNESKERVIETEREFQGTEDDIIKLVNNTRIKKGLTPVKRNEKLMQSALLKAKDMKEKNYFEHVSPEGLEPWFFVEKIGYKYKTFGENLAEGFFSANSVHEGWMNSKGHRENILNKDFREIGVSILDFQQNGMKSYLIVQHFASQLSKKDLEPEIICDKDVKETCEDIEKKEEEIDDVIDKQEDEIKKAKRADASVEDIKKMEDNLEELEKINDEVDDYMEQCKHYIKKCDKWE